jgi:hypothetical protein
LVSPAQTQIIKHPVRLKFEQVFGVQFLGVLERPPGQAHGGQGQRLSGQRDGVDVQSGGLSNGGESQPDKNQRGRQPDGASYRVLHKLFCLRLAR